MTMAAASPNAQIAPFGALRGLAIFIAAVVTFIALLEFPLAVLDLGSIDTTSILDRRFTAARQVAAPLIASTAFVFALLGRVRVAIGTLAALMLLAWTSDLPTFPTGGFEIGFNAVTIWTAAERLVFPVMGVAALVFAIRGTHLAIASVLVVLPALVNVLGFVLFSVFDMQAYSL